MQFCKSVFYVCGSTTGLLYYRKSSLDSGRLWNTPVVYIHCEISSHVLNRSVMSNFLQPHGLLPARFPCPWNSPGKNPGVGSRSLLQRIFPTQGSNLGLLHRKQILYCLSHQGSPEILLITIYSFVLLWPLFKCLYFFKNK